MEKAVFEPVGYAKSRAKKPRVGGWRSAVSEIVVKKKFEEGLDGIGDFSHVVVVYWLDKARGWSLKHRPQGNPEVPRVGIFACRCPNRPNPIGITAAKLLSRKGNRLRVLGLDVIDKTPILDIKPYTPEYDAPKGVKCPAWVGKLRY